MNISYRIDKDILYIAIEGRIDASNAQAFEEEIFNVKKENPNISLKDFEELVLNSDEMSYINLQKEFLVFSNLLISTEKTEEEVRKMVEDIFNSKKEELEQEFNNEKN